MDDPTALKEIILMVQEQASNHGFSPNSIETKNQGEGFSSRVKFMLQTIYDLKNNKHSQGDSPLRQTKSIIKNFLMKRGRLKNNYFLLLGITCRKSFEGSLGR